MNKEEPDGTNNNPTAQAVPKMEVPETSNSNDIKDEDGVWSADIEQVSLMKFFLRSSNPKQWRWNSNLRLISFEVDFKKYKFD